MKAFVSGVTGFAGSHLAEHLLSCDDQVAGSSRRGVWGPDVPSTVKSRVPVLEWDLTAPPSDDVVDQLQAFAPDCIYHLGAISVPAECGGDRPKATAIATNVAGSRFITELAGRLDSGPRLLLVSSCYVYAPVGAHRPQVNEEWPTAPAQAYGQTKLRAELEARDTAEQSSVELLIARAFQHTGPRQSSRMIVPDWARQFATGRDPVRVVCLDTFFDLSDVRDVVRGYRALLLDGTPGEVYNVGSGHCRRSGDIFAALRRQCDANRGVVEIAPGRRQHPIADITRIGQQTHWQPEIDLERTLADTLQYWKVTLEST